MKTYQGTPCIKYGHTERYVSSTGCVVCIKVYGKKKYAKNREKEIERALKYQQANPEKHNAYKKRWVENNRGLKNYYTALRKKKIKQQTPPWADLEKIKQIYINCPDGYEVDHKHPLSKGGLHIHYNLESIPKHDNRVKYNKL